jgi:transcriptional regulator with XRE-family HTH domain
MIEGRPAEVLQSIVKQEVNENGKRPSEIAKKSEISITTVIRIYSGEARKLHDRTIQKLSNALGYNVLEQSEEHLRLAQVEDSRHRTLSEDQKRKIIDSIVRVLQFELDRL